MNGTQDFGQAMMTSLGTSTAAPFAAVPRKLSLRAIRLGRYRQPGIARELKPLQ